MKWGGTTEPCNICGINKERMVRDHNHRTGFIRGVLCEQCNSWLGVYEGNLNRVKKRGKKRYQLWVDTYQGEIEIHLNCNTGIKYRPTSKRNS